MSTLRVLLMMCAVAACGDDSSRHIADSPTGGSDSGSQVQHAPGIYISQANSTLLAFALDADGDTAPFRTIAGSSTMLSLPIGITVDHAGNIYTANRTGSTVTVYGPDATGNVAPIRTLTDAAMLSPEGLVRGAGDDMYVATCPSCGNSAGGDTAMFHFAKDASTSDYSLSGASVGLTNPGSIAVDATGTFVAANAFGGSVVTFAPGAKGNVAPSSTFNPSSSFNVQSMALLTSYVALTAPSTGIVLFDRTATGSPAPAATIAGADFNLGYPGGIFIDTAVSPEIIYLADYGNASIHVLVTAGTEPNLTIASMRTITGASTMLAQPLDIVVVH